MTSSAFPFLWLYGPSGAGKSTVGWEIFRMLGAAGVNSAYVDTDQLGLCYPYRETDHFNHRLKAANLAAAWHGYRQAGAECLVVSGFVESADELRLYEAAVPDLDLTVCRLHASRDVLETRFLGRGHMTEMLADTLQDAENLDRAGLPGVRVVTDGLSPAQIARRLCGAEGPWPTMPGTREDASDV